MLKIPISFKPVPDALPTGRVIISTGIFLFKENGAYILIGDIPAWIYYLQGE